MRPLKSEGVINVAPCYHPLTAYRSRKGRDPETGSWPVEFNVKEGFEDLKVQIPCGRCIGCRLERSRQWAVRCVHEAQMHEDNCFITLTYDDAHMDERRSLNKRDFVLFMKKLRKRYGPNIRFFHCGEYGEQLDRPHHHACLFNFDFLDKVLWSTRSGVRLYRSAALEELWPYGYSTIGSVTFESAAYVARYVMKKITGDRAEEHYDGREPEYVTMSRRPGIGRTWFEEYKDDLFPDDKCVVREGIVCKPPRYYDSLYDNIEPDEMKLIRYRRKKSSCEISSLGEFISPYPNTDEASSDRLEVKEKVQKARAKKLIRPVERINA